MAQEPALDGAFREVLRLCRYWRVIGVRCLTGEDYLAPLRLAVTLPRPDIQPGPWATTHLNLLHTDLSAALHRGDLWPLTGVYQVVIDDGWQLPLRPVRAEPVLDGAVDLAALKV